MRKFIVEVQEDYGIEEVALNIELALDGVVGEPSQDYIVREITDDPIVLEGVVVNDALIETKVNEIVNSIAGVFNIHQVMYASRIVKVKELIITKIKEMM